MAKWKDISSYSRYEDKSQVKSVELIAGRIRLAVTRYIHNPGKWHLNCDALRYDFRELESDDLEAAKAEALLIVHADLLSASDDVYLSLTARAA